MLLAKVPSLNKVLNEVGGGRDPHQRRQWGGRLALRQPPRN